MLAINTPPVEFRRAIAYVRFSPKPKGKLDPDTLEVQEQSIQRYCTMWDIQIVRTLRDPSVSARTTRLYDRPEGSEIPGLLAGGIKHIIAVRTDRIWRDSEDGIACMREWTKLGVEAHFANQGGVSFNASTAHGRFVLRTFLNLSEWEADIIGERTGHSMRSYQSAGRRMTRTDRLPWGTMLDPENPKRAIACDDELAVSAAIKTMLGVDGFSLGSIAAQLNNKQVLCRGKNWNHQSVRRAIKTKVEAGA